jgi:catechol 2,3-dioxygenase-like lactoylglutathione lyase family enzyme
MSITLLYGCAHIELSVGDLDAARAFLQAVLGATSIEDTLAGDLRALVPAGHRIDHLECGQATFQLNQPAPAVDGHGAVHRQYLDRAGPCVTNLNFYVDDIGHAHDVLRDLGAETLIQGPSSLAPSLADYGPANTRPGARERPFLYLGTRSLLGFDLELMEPNFLRFADQEVQRPCFVGPRPPSDVEGLRLQRLRVAVDDLAATYANLLAVLTPGSRSQPYGRQAGPSSQAFRITVGGIELEYCQPVGTAGPLADHLGRYGPGVVTLEFGATDPGAVLDRMPTDEAWRIAPAETPASERQPIAARDLVGFDIVVGELDERLLVVTP